MVAVVVVLHLVWVCISLYLTHRIGVMGRTSVFFVQLPNMAAAGPFH